MAVSGTVILLALRLQKSLPPTEFPVSPIPQSQPIPRSCISSEAKKEKEKRKKKRVHFAEDVVEPSGNSEEFRRQRSGKINSPPSSKLKESGKVGGMPANRVALYNGILRDRVVQRLPLASAIFCFAAAVNDSQSPLRSIRSLTSIISSHEANPKHKQRQGMSTFSYDGPLPPMSLETNAKPEITFNHSLRAGLPSPSTHKE
ncbi:hypothetical protein F0562_030103 [Nyssa sinensis]|uniref:Uncharacterized protein n=1 Tax=Nyssa sinensis TaxID=561372 RepID=A0A5J5AXP8_9ASTE|nr:hypothetical protein F0562_030103 [Nyssa sinensis]